MLVLLTCCRALCPAARCDRMERAASRRRHTPWAPIWACSRTRIAPPTDLWSLFDSLDWHQSVAIALAWCAPSARRWHSPRDAQVCCSCSADRRRVASRPDSLCCLRWEWEWQEKQNTGSEWVSETDSSHLLFVLVMLIDYLRHNAAYAQCGN